MEQNPTQPAPQQSAPESPKKSSSNAVVIIVVVVVVLLIAGLVGGYFVFRSIKARVSQKIGQSIGENMLEKAIEQGTGQKVDVDSNGDSVSVKTDSGTWSASETGNIKLPSDFPSDVFVLSGAKITFATSTPANPAEGTKASAIIGYEVSQNMDEVANKYREEMVKNGWTKETEANYGTMTISFKKGAREATVGITGSQDSRNGGAEVSVSLYEY